ncbi:MAG: UDP-3-O-(3-hydroxymyristoyl)glucosamine N-acyltransferase [Candidatus Saganbacteria bacterium]|nr:UDP-3-O-(3-hydroxymyristoyl)glucosamine N-acyltransferase [Candidatus Saganbacteria bacterium]
MQKTVREIAMLVSGEIAGDGSLKIKGIASLDEAEEGDLSFYLDPGYDEKFRKTKASALIVPKGKKIAGKTLISVKNPREAFAKVLKLFEPEKAKPRGIHETFIQGEDVRIGKDANIGPFVTLGNKVILGKGVNIYPGAYIGDKVEIGEDAIIYPNVTIYERVKIGKRVIIHAGAVIGGDGFGFVQSGGENIKIPQIGTVTIEDDVEIYPNTCIARGTLGATIIRRGTKIDNLAHIAHNVDIGENCLVTALAGFSGSVTLGKNIMVGGQAGFVDHVAIGDNSLVSAKAGVTKDFPKGSNVSGFPSRDHKEWLKVSALSNRLPELFERVLKLEKSKKKTPKK